MSGANKQQLYIIPDQQINKTKEQIKPNRKQDPSPQTYHVYQKDSKKDNQINYSVILDEQQDQLNKTSQSAIRQGLKSASLRKQQSDNAPSENNKSKINKGIISNVKQAKEQQLIAKSQISQDFQVYQNQIMNKSDLTNNQGSHKIGTRNIPQTNSNGIYYKDSRRIARGGSGIDVETSMNQNVADRYELSIIRKENKEMRTSSATAGPTTDEFGLEGQRGYNFIKKGNFMTNETNNTLYGGFSIPRDKPSQAYEGSLFDKSQVSANNQNINGKLFNAENFHENFQQNTLSQFNSKKNIQIGNLMMNQDSMIAQENRSFYNAHQKSDEAQAWLENNTNNTIKRVLNNQNFNNSVISKNEQKILKQQNHNHTVLLDKNSMNNQLLQFQNIELIKSGALSGGVRPNRAQRSSKNKLLNRGSALGNISQSGMKKSSNNVQTPVSNIVYGIYRESSSQRSLGRNTMQQDSEDRQAIEIEKGRFLQSTTNNIKVENSIKTATLRLQQQAAEIHRLSFNKSATPVGISNSKGTKPSVRKNSVYNSSTIAAINELAPQSQILQQSGFQNLSTVIQNKNVPKQQFQGRGPSLGINESQNMAHNKTQYSQQMQNFLQQQINFSLNPNTNSAIGGLVRDNIITNLGIQNNRMTPVMAIKNRSATTTAKGGAILVGPNTGKLNKQNIQNQQSQINYYNSNLINSNEARNTLIDQQFQMQGFQGEGKHHTTQIPQGQGSESHEIYQAGVQSKNQMILQVPSVIKQSTKKLNKKLVSHNQVLVSDRLRNNQKKKDNSQFINQSKERLNSNQRKKGTQTVIGVQKPQSTLNFTNQFGQRIQAVSVIGPQTSKVFSTSLPRQARENEQYIAGINSLNNTYMTQIINNQKSSQQSLKQAQLRRDSESDNLPNEQYQRMDNEYSNIKEEAQASIAEQALTEMQNALNNQNDNSQIFLNIDDQAVQLSLNQDMLQSPSQFTENQFNDTSNLQNALDETQDFFNKQQDKKYSYPIKGGRESSSIKIEDEAQYIQQSNYKDKSNQYINQKLKLQNVSNLPQHDDQWNSYIEMQPSLEHSQNSPNKNLLIQEQTSTAKFKNKDKQKLATLNEDEIDKEQFLKIVNNAFYKIISSLNPRIGASLHQIQQMYSHFIEQVEQNHFQELQQNAIQILSLQNQVEGLNNKLDAVMSEQVQSIQSSQVQKSNKIISKKNTTQNSVQREQIIFQNNKINSKKKENVEQRISYVDADKSCNIQKSLADKLSINDKGSNDIYIQDPLNLDGDILVENIAEYQNSGRQRIVSEIGKSEDRRGGKDAMVFYDNQREPKVFKQNKQGLRISELPQDDNPFDNDRCESRLGHRDKNSHNQKIYIQNDDKNRSRRGFDDSTSRVDESVYDELMNERLIMDNHGKNMIQIEDNAMEFEDEEGGVNSISRQKQITAGGMMPSQQSSDMHSSSSVSSSMLLSYAETKQKTHKKQKSVVPELDLGKLQSQMEIERIQEIDQQNLIDADINEEFFNMEFMDPDNDCNRTIVESQYQDHQASSQDYGSKSIDDSSQSEDMLDMINQLAGMPTKPQGIPKLGLKMPLNIANVQKEYVNDNEDFQDEFMGKYDQFSESWRQAIQRQKRF